MFTDIRRRYFRQRIFGENMFRGCSTVFDFSSFGTFRKFDNNSRTVYPSFCENIFRAHNIHDSDHFHSDGMHFRAVELHLSKAHTRSIQIPEQFSLRQKLFLRQQSETWIRILRIVQKQENKLAVGH